MSTSGPVSTGTRSVAVGLFERGWQAREAARELLRRGIDHTELGLLVPSGDRLCTIRDNDGGSLLPDLARWDDVHTVLANLGVPEGESRFYSLEVAERRRALVVTRVRGNYAAIHEVLLHHDGYDVQSRGGDLAAAEDVGVAGDAQPMPPDLTNHWKDVSSRYEMLWQQHYGTSDATWEQVQPVYQFAWHMANDPRWRGRAWSACEEMVRGAWEGSGGTDWPAVRGAVHDVWVDVAEDVVHGNEGGTDRRVPGPSTDQSVAARDLRPSDGSTP